LNAPRSDWGALTAEAIDHLRRLIQIDTTNPPGNEVEACRYLADVLSRDGIQATILESGPGRGNLVARLRGDGSKRPLLLLSHLDVVPAEPSYWHADPFGAAIKDEFIWGRGSVDTKNLTAWQLVCMLELRRTGAYLKRDVILVGTADEEAGGVHGAGWLVANHPDLLDAEYGLNEGGGYDMVVGGKRFFTCQTSEKELCWLILRAEGSAGHAAVPHRDNAVVHLAEAVARLGIADLPPHRTTTTDSFVDALGSAMLPAERSSLQQIWQPDGWSHVERLPLDAAVLRQLRSTVRNTATPTILQAGSAVNVIPTQAVARVDGRILPGQTPEGFAAEVQAVVGDRVHVEIADTSHPTQESSPRGPFVDAVRAAIARHEPAAEVVPLMSLGATDSRYLRRRGRTDVRLQASAPGAWRRDEHPDAQPRRAYFAGQCRFRTAGIVGSGEYASP